MAFLPGAGFVASVSATASVGDIIKGETFSTLYYYAADGMRYVFPNEKTYFTWYSDFTQITPLTDEELGDIQIGGNVTYKPGVRLLKIDTDPKTYAVEQGGLLRWVESEPIAAAIYGGDWTEKIDDLPDALFANYAVGPSVQHPDEYILRDVLDAVTTIDDEKGIVVPPVITLTGQGYSPISVTIAPGTSVRFVNNDTYHHTITAEDLTWGSGTLAAGAEFVHTFESAGTYPFFDSYNSRNSGAVFVQVSSE